MAGRTTRSRSRSMGRFEHVELTPTPRGSRAGSVVSNTSGTSRTRMNGRVQSPVVSVDAAAKIAELTEQLKRAREESAQKNSDLIAAKLEIAELKMKVQHANILKEDADRRAAAALDVSDKEVDTKTRMTIDNQECEIKQLKRELEKMNWKKKRATIAEELAELDDHEKERSRNQDNDILDQIIAQMGEVMQDSKKYLAKKTPARAPAQKNPADALPKSVLKTRPKDSLLTTTPTRPSSIIAPTMTHKKDAHKTNTTTRSSSIIAPTTTHRKEANTPTRKSSIVVPKESCSQGANLSSALARSSSLLSPTLTRSQDHRASTPYPRVRGPHSSSNHRDQSEEDQQCDLCVTVHSFKNCPLDRKVKIERLHSQGRYCEACVTKGCMGDCEKSCSRCKQRGHHFTLCGQRP